MRYTFLLIGAFLAAGVVQAIAQDEAKPSDKQAQGGGDLRAAASKIRIDAPDCP